MTITSVTLSGATAESKGLEFAEHAPVRFARALAISPSRPLDFARGDSLCCHVERSDSEVETSRLDGTFTFTNHTRNAHNAETNINDRSRCCIIPRLERGTPAVDGFVTYHSTFSSLDGGAFHPFESHPSHDWPACPHLISHPWRACRFRKFIHPTYRNVRRRRTVRKD